MQTRKRTHIRVLKKKNWKLAPILSLMSITYNTDQCQMIRMHISWQEMTLVTRKWNQVSWQSVIIRLIHEFCKTRQPLRTTRSLVMYAVVAFLCSNRCNLMLCNLNYTFVSPVSRSRRLGRSKTFRQIHESTNDNYSDIKLYCLFHIEY